MPSTENNPLLILDLDETLIYGTGRALARPHDCRAGPFFIYKRPGLDQFLASVTARYRLAVWSSASCDYVAAITRSIFPAEIALEFQWSQERCVRRYDAEWQDYYWIKDLKKVRRLGFDLNRVLIVDDTPEKVERNFGNAVYIRAFEGDQNDQELERLASYLILLADCDNFRTIEKRGWRIR